MAALCRRVDFPLRKSQVYAVLRGEVRHPPPWDFVRVFVRACAEYAARSGRRLSVSPREEDWRSEYDFVARTVEKERRLQRTRSDAADRTPADAVASVTATSPAAPESELLEAGMYLWTGADFAAGLATTGELTAAPGPDERVDVALLRRGRLPGLQRAFAPLVARFRDWLAGQDDSALALLCLVEENTPHRSLALLACLSHGQEDGFSVCDAGADLDALSRAMEILLIPPAPAPPLLAAVDLPDELPADVWTELCHTLAQARKLASGTGSWPRLVIAGTADQCAAATRALRGLVHVTCIEPNDGSRHRTSARPAGVRPRQGEAHSLHRHPASARRAQLGPGSRRAAAVENAAPVGPTLAGGGSADPASLLALGTHLLGQAASRRSLLEHGEATEHTWASTRRCFDEAVELIRAAGHPSHLVRALVERAHFWRVRREPGDDVLAAADLDHAESVAIAGRAQLVLADVWLERLACQLTFRGTPAVEPAGQPGAGVASLAEVDQLIRALAHGRRLAMLAIRRRAAA